MNKKKQIKGLNENKELRNKLTSIQELILKNRDNSTTDEPESQEIFKKHLHYLSEIVKSRTIEDNRTNQLCETLYELAKMKVSLSLIQDSHIQSFLKIIAQACKKSSSQTVKKLGIVVKSLRKHWKSYLKSMSLEYNESYIPNRYLRNVVCRKIANVFEYNHFERAKAQELAISIERKIRKMDPTMTKKYHICFSKMIKEIKFITPSLYKQLRKC